MLDKLPQVHLSPLIYKFQLSERVIERTPIQLTNHTWSLVRASIRAALTADEWEGRKNPFKVGPKGCVLRSFKPIIIRR